MNKKPIFHKAEETQVTWIQEEGTLSLHQLVQIIACQVWWDLNQQPMEEAFHLKEWTQERECKAKRIHISKTTLDQNIHHSSCNFIQHEFRQL